MAAAAAAAASTRRTTRWCCCSSCRRSVGACLCVPLRVCACPYDRSVGEKKGEGITTPRRPVYARVTHTPCTAPRHSCCSRLPRADRSPTRSHEHKYPCGTLFLFVSPLFILFFFSVLHTAGYTLGGRLPLKKDARPIDTYRHYIYYIRVVIIIIIIISIYTHTACFCFFSFNRPMCVVHYYYNIIYVICARESKMTSQYCATVRLVLLKVSLSIYIYILYHSEKRVAE